MSEFALHDPDDDAILRREFHAARTNGSTRATARAQVGPRVRTHAEVVHWCPYVLAEDVPAVVADPSSRYWSAVSANAFVARVCMQVIHELGHHVTAGVLVDWLEVGLDDWLAWASRRGVAICPIHGPDVDDLSGRLTD